MDIDPSTTYVNSYDQLTLSCLDPEQHERTCNYWYAVSNNWTSHHAFTTVADLYEWLTERGLTLASPLPEQRGTHKVIDIIGGYRSAVHCDLKTFMAIETLDMIPVLSNAEYTLGKITADEDGQRTLHCPNVSCREGAFPWPRSRHDAIVTIADSKQFVLDYIALTTLNATARSL